jgi:hypothetical protein
VKEIGPASWSGSTGDVVLSLCSDCHGIADLGI